MSEHCPIIIMGEFNVDILKNNNQAKKKKKKKILYFMDNFQNHNLVKTPQKLGFN
jgi:hypothetical protein